MRYQLLPLLVLPLLSLSLAAEVTYTSLPACAHDCALEYAAQMNNCYLPTNAMCMCGSIQLLYDAYQCTITPCAGESAKTQKIVQDWFNMVCEPGSDESQLGSGYSTDSATGTPTAMSSSVSQTATVKATGTAAGGSAKDPEKGTIGLGTVVGIVGGLAGMAAGVFGFWAWRRRQMRGVVPLEGNENQWPGMRHEIGGEEVPKTPPAVYEVGGGMVPVVYEAGSGKRESIPPVELQGSYRV